MSYLVFDTESTGLVRFNLPSNHPQQPNLVQLAAILFDDNHNEQASLNVMIRPLDNWIIPDDVVKIHGITTEHANKYGVMPHVAADIIHDLFDNADTLVAHNIEFDAIVMENFMSIFNRTLYLNSRKTFCTMKASKDICRLPSYSGYKWPRLNEAYRIIVGKEMIEGKAHSALYDCICCAELYQKLVAGS